jgi:hypothetical protein
VHSNIKRFQVDGIINDDADFPRLRSQFEDMLVKDMRSSGYAPVLDLGPFFSTVYREDDSYNFVITAYGVYLGRRKAQLCMGISNGRPVPITQKSK